MNEKNWEYLQDHAAHAHADAAEHAGHGLRAGDQQIGMLCEEIEETIFLRHDRAKDIDHAGSPAARAHNSGRTGRKAQSRRLAATGGVLGALVGLGIPEEDANFYSEGVRRGGTLVIAKTTDEMANRAYDIMQRYGAVDVDKRGAEWRSSGWKRSRRRGRSRSRSSTA